jgi:hypothetical protein
MGAAMLNKHNAIRRVAPPFRLVVLLAVLTVVPPALTDDLSEDEDRTVTPKTPPEDGPEADRHIRENIIQLIEEDLPNAYSFSPSSVHKAPHFEVLDEIHPKWHHGNPAKARQFWVSAGYTAFRVFYRVDYVYLVNDVVVEVEGKRLVMWSQLDEAPDWDKYWPFQFWASLSKRSQRDDSYLSAMYTMRYKMKLAINEKEAWTIAEERFEDNPEMVNNLRDHCTYEEQLADWGLKNDCNKKLLPE